MPFRLSQGFWGDLKLAVRRLVASPLFTIFAVLSIASGVAVTTAVYSVVDSFAAHLARRTRPGGLREGGPAIAASVRA